MLVITLKRSYIGCNPTQRATLKALGLRKMHQSIAHAESDSIRGMIKTVEHLVEVQTNAS